MGVRRKKAKKMIVMMEFLPCFEALGALPSMTIHTHPLEFLLCFEALEPWEHIVFDDVVIILESS